MSSPLDIKVVANNTIWVYATVNYPDGTPVDITGYTIKWQARRNPDAAPVITKSTLAGNIIIVSGINGQFGFQILASDTVNLPYGDYIHEAVTVDPTGSPVTMTNNDAQLTSGNLFIRQQYTAQ